MPFLPSLCRAVTRLPGHRLWMQDAAGRKGSSLSHVCALLSQLGLPALGPEELRQAAAGAPELARVAPEATRAEAGTPVYWGL